MGKATLPDKRSGQHDTDPHVVDGSVPTQTSSGGRKHSAPDPAGGQAGDPAKASQQGNRGGAPEPAANDHQRETQAKLRARNMRRILPRVDQFRLALFALNAAVRDAEADGLSRDAIVEAIHRTTDDWHLQYLRLSECSDLLNAVHAPVAFDLIRLDDQPVSSKAMRAEAAAEDGYHAEIVGRSIEACPYDHRQSDLRRAWRSGWSRSREGLDLNA